MPTVRTNGIDTYYERRGTGPTVVFVHASVLDHSLWDAQVEALAGEFTTLVYDLRGHGRTGPSDRPVYTMALYAEDLAALLDALNVDRPVVCGLSMGGMVAQSFATRYPDRVGGLVVADALTPPVLTRGDWFLRRVLLPALVPPVRLFGYERVERATVWLTERLVRGAGGDYDRVRALRRTGPRVRTAEFAKVVRAMARFHEERVDLSAVRAPALVVYGESELPAVAVHAASLATTLPDAEVVVVPGAGHASNLDDPDFFTSALRRFLTRVAGPDGASPHDVWTGVDG